MTGTRNTGVEVGADTLGSESICASYAAFVKAGRCFDRTDPAKDPFYFTACMTVRS